MPFLVASQRRGRIFTFSIERCLFIAIRNSVVALCTFLILFSSLSSSAQQQSIGGVDFTFVRGAFASNATTRAPHSTTTSTKPPKATCTATFSMPLADTYIVPITHLTSLPEYSPLSGRDSFTYYRISSVDLSRSQDVTINVALSGGTFNTSFNVMENGLTELPLLAESGIGTGDSGDDGGISAAYASVYDRYLSFGQFADAATQARTNMDQLRTSAFSKEGGSEVLGNGKFLVSPKARLLGSLMVPADYIDVSTDYDSPEGHGVADVVFKKYGRIDVVPTPTFMTITLRSFSSYRIANDEYIYFNFFNNLTEPAGCLADAPLVIHITGYQSSTMGQIATFTCFVVLVISLVLILFGTVIPTSHHAGVVGMLSVSRFAFEDGQHLPLILSPLQASLGSDKYQYVLGGAVANVGILIIVALIQLAGMYILKYKQIPSREAAGVIRWPFVSMAFFAHLSPQIFFLLGRVLGRINYASIIVASVIILLLTSAIVAMSKKVLSANDNFGAFVDTSNVDSRRYRRAGGHRNRHSSDVPSGEVFGAVRLDNDPLLEAMPVFGGMFKAKGEWVARQPVHFLLERWGYLFMPYRKKHWLLIEFGDSMVCGLVSVLDNYTSALAMYQYGIFTVTKLLILILIIALRPALKSLDTNMMFLSYAGQLLACIGLFVGSIKAQMNDAFSVVKDVSLLFVSFVLVAHVLLVMFESIRNFYRRVRITDERRQAYELERQRHAIVAEMIEKEAAENDARLEAAERARNESFGHNAAALVGFGDNVNQQRSRSRSVGGTSAAARRRRALQPFGSQVAESTLLDTLVEGHLPGTIGARQVEARKLKYDPRNILPAQDAFRIHNDGTITVMESVVGGVGRAYDGFTAEDRNNKSGSEDEYTKARNKNSAAAASGVAMKKGAAHRLRELKTRNGTIMIDPVYATWGLDGSSSSSSGGDSDYDQSRHSGDGTRSRLMGGGSRRGGAASAVSGSRKSSGGRSGSRFGGKAVLSSGPSQAQELSTSSEDSDSNYDSEGLPITSVEQRIRKQNKRAARAKRRADKKMRLQGGVMDADGDFLVEEDLEELMMANTFNGEATFSGGGGGGALDDLLGGEQTTTLRRGASNRNMGGGMLRSGSPTNAPFDPATYKLPTTRKFQYSTIVSSPTSQRAAARGGAATAASTSGFPSSPASVLSPRGGGLTLEAMRHHSVMGHTAGMGGSTMRNASFGGYGGIGLSSAALASPTGALALGALPLSEDEERLRAKQHRRRERREQKQLSRGIVTSTANLCKNIPNGGVNIQQFNAFVDSIPNLSVEERSKYKRRLADKIRTIFRDRAREAANKKMQERIKTAMAVSNANHSALVLGAAGKIGAGGTVIDPITGAVVVGDLSEHNATGLHDMRVTKQIQLSLWTGGVRGMYSRQEAAQKTNTAAKANNAAVSSPLTSAGNTTAAAQQRRASKQQLRVIGRLSSSEDGDSSSSDSTESYDSAHPHGIDEDYFDAATTIGGGTSAGMYTADDDDRRSAVSGKSRTSKYSSRTRRNHNTLNFASSKANSSAGDGGGGGGNNSSGGESNAMRKLRKRFGRPGFTDDDVRLEEEIARQKELNREHNKRHLRNTGGGGGGVPGGGGLTRRGAHKAGGAAGVSHDWLVLDDEVQANAAQYAARMVDTLEALAAHTAPSAGPSSPARGGGTGGSAVVDIPASPNTNGKVDAAHQRLAHQTGTLIAVWESIGNQVQQLSNEAAAKKQSEMAEDSIYTVGFTNKRKGAAPAAAPTPQQHSGGSKDYGL